MDAEKMFLFNHEQISRVYFIGHQDEEQLAFAQKAKEVIKEARGE